MPRRQTGSVNKQIIYPHAQGHRANVGGHAVGTADARRGYIFTPSGRVSLSALRDEQAAEDSAGEIDTEQAVRDAREALTKLPQYVQQGGEVISDERRQQRSAISQAGLAALDVAGPLAEAGLLNNAQLGALLSKEVGASFNDQRQQRQISKEIQALQSQYRQGRLNEASLQKAVSSMYAEYGTGLFANPQFASLSGLEEQRENANQQKMQAFAQSEGLPANRVRINPETGAPQFDAQAASIDVYKSNMADAENQRNTQAYNSRAKDFTVRLTSMERQMASLAPLANEGDATAASVYRRIQGEYLKLLERPVMTADSEPTTERQVSAMGPEMLGTTPKPPSFNFANQTDALNAANSGTWPVGTTGNINGVQYRVGADRTIRRAK